MDPTLLTAQVGQQITPESLAAHTAWVKGSKEVAGIMLITMEPKIILDLENLSAYEMLQDLKTLFAQQADHELLQTEQNYCIAIPRDGIFEIDLSNSYANDSSMYSVSNKRAKLDLDSALSWHCRLGHISKKRIEKLQHDGLLNSPDLRVFEKCVS
ncbi:retrotransposon protein, putative, ty1-copia subclass, partial [Tanacetum coccineum]